MMDYDLEEAEFARTVLTRGQRRLVVTDHTKFGRQGLVRVCGFEAVGELVTDREPPLEIAEQIKAAGSSLVVVA
jgi:DeoR family transcriptional regulator, glycerol-3-phosphate regulon repressor